MEKIWNSKKVIFRELVEFPSTTYATFSLYRYPAKFIPHIIAYALENYAKPGMKVFDPFAGYGTVGVVCKIYGYDYEMWDLNPMLEVLHKISTMGRPKEAKIRNTINAIDHMLLSNEKFIPDWERHLYWFPEEFLPFLYNVWGYYHSLKDKTIKLILTIPLLKTTRHFSYDDPQRQKLSKSLKSKKRIKSLLSSNWKQKFFEQLRNETLKVIYGINKYWELSPKKTESVVKGGIDSLNEHLAEMKDILITSPPYLQSQEYIRYAKLDLFWLGYSENKIKELSKLEVPYRDVPVCPINSVTFEKYENEIKEEHIRKVFRRYFWGILGSLTRLQEKISSYLLLFVGHASARGLPIPIDRIFIEHFTSLGWKHETTLVDKIVSRRLFSYKVNPATGIKDIRTPVENLVVLKRKD